LVAICLFNLKDNSALDTPSIHGKAGIKLKTKNDIYDEKEEKNYSHLHRLIIAPPASAFLETL
jgi:hypothetical protein